MKKIAILTWWPGYEREVALKSVKLFENNILAEYETFIFPEDLDNFLAKKEKFSCVIPVFHGEYGEDGRIQAFLDVLWIPYLGSWYYWNALCMNKREANIIAQNAWLRVPDEISLRKWEPITLDNFSLIFPVILKPNTGGSSCYTYKVESFSDLEEKVQYIWEYISDDLLVQEYILWDEYSVSVVNREILDAVMKVEKDNPADMFDYESKYESEANMRETFPDISLELKNKLKENTQRAIDVFHIQGFARVDFIVRNNEVFFLEVNTIPGCSEVSILPKAWQFSGRSLQELVETLILSVKN